MIEYSYNFVLQDEKVRQSGLVLRAGAFYESEYRELCIQQLSLYQPEKMSMAYLKDLVETTHVFLKLMEHWSKSSHIMISSKKVKRKTKKTAKAKATKKADGFLSQRESNEQKWDAISSELSDLLQAPKEDLPDIVAPFDAASEVPIGKCLCNFMITSLSGLDLQNHNLNFRYPL